MFSSLFSLFNPAQRVLAGLAAFCLPMAESSAEAPTVPWAWPTPSKLSDGDAALQAYVQPTSSGEPLSALFGCVRNSGHRFHEGLDITPVLERRRGQATDPIYAVHSGVVRHVNRISGHSSYGRYVVIEHDDLAPAIYSLYSHISSVADGIEPGVTVVAGQEIATMGNTAGGYRIPLIRSHLHLEFGLRISDDFDSWYQRQEFGSANHHGNFNGMNLTGWDPLAYLEGLRDGQFRQPLDYLQSIPPAFVVHVAVDRRPGFLNRYPRLELQGCDPSLRAGWKIVVSGFGLPLAFQGITYEEIRGVTHPGDASVVAADPAELDRFGCRDLVSESSAGFRLDSNGRQLLELLFE